ncbi:hypothetical protein [Streptomyces sp. NBC_01728]|uniref:hypothetical protein n=1 Tax=Streptomyces sp. NBC_01728 TaxID=2975925 RepID=UPI002257B3FA|nr:hypothetical protein [Streptomyces sp. NBC_01728]
MHQRAQQAEEFLGVVDVGLGGGQLGSAAVVGGAGEFLVQGVFEDLVGAQREVVRVEVLVAEVLFGAATSSTSCWACEASEAASVR